MIFFYRKFQIRYVVFDLSGIHYVDPAGVAAIKRLIEDLNSLNIQFYAAGTSGTLLLMIVNSIGIVLKTNK